MNQLHYNILQPKHKVDNPPLLLMLHGYGSDENDLFSFAELLNDRFMVVSARAPQNLPWGGYAWYDINFTNPAERFGNPDQAKQSMGMILELIKTIQQEFKTARSKTVLLGFSQGAILSYGLSLNYPELFSKVLAMSGYIFEEIMPDVIAENKTRHLDYFQSHGTADEVIPVAWARNADKWLSEKKLKHVFKEYAGMGHGINELCFRDMLHWVAQRYPAL